MANGHGIPLRTLSWGVTGVVVGVALAVSTALVVLTTFLHQANVHVLASVESLLRRPSLSTPRGWAPLASLR